MQRDCLKGRIVCGTVYGDMHFKISWDQSKSRVSNLGIRFLSSATWPLLHYNGLINQPISSCYRRYRGIVQNSTGRDR